MTNICHLKTVANPLISQIKQDTSKEHLTHWLSSAPSLAVMSNTLQRSILRVPVTIHQRERSVFSGMSLAVTGVSLLGEFRLWRNTRAQGSVCSQNKGPQLSQALVLTRAKARAKFLSQKHRHQYFTRSKAVLFN